MIVSQRPIFNAFNCERSSVCVCVLMCVCVCIYFIFLYGIQYLFLYISFFFRDEHNLIEQITADVKTKLEHKSQYAVEILFGIDEIIKPIEELLKNSDKVGIWGWVVPVRPQWQRMCLTNYHISMILAAFWKM